MKKQILYLTATILSGLSCSAQSPVGLIAHWQMSGNGADATGRGHDGTVHSVYPATGRSGIPGTAMFFDGASSHINVPYQPDLNLKQYTICATVKVARFNDGQCQSNYIMARGGQLGASSYSLLFFENPYTSCDDFDSTKEVFAAEAGSVPGSHAGWRYSPNIANGTWYSVVATWDGSSFGIYVDGVKMSSNKVPGAVPLGSGNAGILIGRLSTTGGYQYPFTGFMDDLRIYDRVICENEIMAYAEGPLDAAGRSTAEIACDSTLNVPNKNGLADLRLYPNPAAVTVSLLGDVRAASFRIVNALGQTAMAGSFQGTGSAISVAALASGMYYLQVTRGDQTKTLRFIRE